MLWHQKFDCTHRSIQLKIMNPISFEVTCLLGVFNKQTILKISWDSLCRENPWWLQWIKLECVENQYVEREIRFLCNVNGNLVVANSTHFLRIASTHRITSLLSTQKEKKVKKAFFLYGPFPSSCDTHKPAIRIAHLLVGSWCLFVTGWLSLVRSWCLFHQVKWHFDVCNWVAKSDEISMFVWASLAKFWCL